MSVTSKSSGNRRTITVNVTAAYACADDKDKYWSVKPVSIAEASATTGTVISRTQGPAPVCGTFRIGRPGKWSNPIDFRKAYSHHWNGLDTRWALDFEKNLRGSSLKLEAYRGWDWVPQRQMDFFLQYTDAMDDGSAAIGGPAAVRVDTESLTGDFKVTVTNVLAADKDAVWMSSVPADLFQLPQEMVANASSAVVVTSNGIAGGAADTITTAPMYSYKPSYTPILSTAFTSRGPLSAGVLMVAVGDSITVLVSNLLQHVQNQSSPQVRTPCACALCARLVPVPYTHALCAAPCQRI